MAPPGDMAPAGHVSARHGVRRIPGVDRRAVSLRRSWASRCRRSCLAQPCSLSGVRLSFAAAALVGVFALFHGHAHGAELASRRKRSSLQHRVRHRDRLVAPHRHQHRHGAGRGGSGRRFLQAAGACVAMGGVYFLWQAVVSERGRLAHEGRPRQALPVSYWPCVRATPRRI